MPTYVDDLARACISAAEKKPKEFLIFLRETHELSRHRKYYRRTFLSRQFFNKSREDTDLNQAAKRPLTTGFDLSKSISTLNYSPTPFSETLSILYP